MSVRVRVLVVGIGLAILLVLLSLLLLRKSPLPPSPLSDTGISTSTEPTAQVIPAPVTTSNVAAIVAGGPYQVVVTSGIPYATVNGQVLTFDLYEPKGVTLPMPLIVYTHGGGFRGGDSDVGNATASGNKLAARGYAVASINYELSGEASLPAPINDEFGAIRFFRANAAKYDIDPGRIATMGDSAGSVLATMVGVMADNPKFYGTVGGNLNQSSTVQGVIAVSGEWFSTDLSELTPVHVSAHIQALGCATTLAAPDCVAKIDTFFPEFNLDKDDPPIIILQGTADTATPEDNAIDLTSAMKAVGIDVTLVLNQGLGHGDKNEFQAIDKVYSFLDTTFEK